jgi:molybdopterin converting factor small subunit
MVITLKLGTTLRQQAPEYFVGGEGRLQLAAGATVGDLLDVLGLEPDQVNLVYLNHRLVSLEARLEDGDRLALFPPNFIHFHQFYLKRGT